MSNDRELLQQAAKATGIRYTVEDDEYYKTRKFFGLWLVYDFEPNEHTRRYWNPLTNDGDALRLAVTLGIAVEQFYSGPIENPEWMFTRARRFEAEASCGRPGDIDQYAATRRAIVLAAAEISHQMQKGGAA